MKLLDWVIYVYLIINYQLFLYIAVLVLLMKLLDWVIDVYLIVNFAIWFLLLTVGKVVLCVCLFCYMITLAVLLFLLLIIRICSCL